MLPGLHPGLLVARQKKLVFEGLPADLYISTSGGEGYRQLALGIEVKNGLAPYQFEWAITLDGFMANPPNGAGTSANGYVFFEANVYVDGQLSDYREVGEAYLQVIDAAGRIESARVRVYAGQ